MVRIGLASCAFLLGTVLADDEASSLLSVKAVTRPAQPGGAYGYGYVPTTTTTTTTTEETAAAVIVDTFETVSTFKGGEWVQEVTFREPMAETPVVVPFMSFNGGHPAQIRVLEVSPTGFKTAMAEPPSCTGCHGGDGPHMSETVNYIAAVPGETTMGDIRFLAGVADVKETVGSPLFGKRVTGSGQQIDFEDKFDGTPAFLAALQSSNSFEFAGEAGPVTPWLTAGVLKVSAKGAEVALDRTEVDQGKPKKESVGWIAISIGTGVVNAEEGEISYKIKNAVRGDKRLGWEDADKGSCKVCEKTSIKYGKAAGDDGDDVITVAAMSSRRGNNGGWLRTTERDDKKIAIVVDEDTFHDNDREHVPEEVSSAMFSRSFAFHTTAN